ncbi:hypothetical protein ES703_125929 [subsurface metagenome]
MGRQVTDHSRPARESGASEACAVQRLSDDRVGPVFGGPHDHVVSFGVGDAEFVHNDRLDVVAVGLNDLHLQSGNAHVEVRHRRPVDESQTDALARSEESGEVLLRCPAVDQEGIGRHVRDVGGIHAHQRPCDTVVDDGPSSLFGRRLVQLLEEAHQRAPVEIVPAAVGLQVLDDAFRVVAPVRQHDDVVAVVPKRLVVARFDDHRTVDAQLLLLSGRMTVIPVGAGLL